MSQQRLHLVEVGANLGDCLLFLLSRYKRARGLAVEAIASTAAHIERSVQLNDGLSRRMKVLPGLAITDEAPS